MSVHAIFALTPDLVRTLPMLHKISELGISVDVVSLLMAEERLSLIDRDLIHQRVLDALLGVHTHINVFPSLGPLLVIGPLQEKLRAAAIAASPDRASNGFMTCLTRLGVPRPAAVIYANGLHQGRVLIAVHSKTDEERAGLTRLITSLGVIP